MAGIYPSVVRYFYIACSHSPASPARVSRTLPFVHLDFRCTGQDVGSDCGVSGISGPEGDTAVYFMPKDKRETANSIPFEF